MWPSPTVSGRTVAHIAAPTLLLANAAIAVAATSVQRVVILYDERPELPGLALPDRGITDTLGSGAAGTPEVGHRV